MSAPDDGADVPTDEAASGPPDPDDDTHRTGPRISPVEGFFMLALALFFDGATLLLSFVMLSGLISITSWLSFYVWFHAKGMGFNKKLMKAIKSGDAMSMGKNPAVINAVVSLIEATPLGALPTITLGIVTILLIEYAEYYMSKFGGASFAKKVPAQ